ncbi:uncharacterized protein [Onthophagus taurus]|uniref:uncharacterized protein n=1 Tax=Onthophagus taurus TaxID=166361 RepID=UPI0039BDDB57
MTTTTDKLQKAVLKRTSLLNRLNETLTYGQNLISEEDKCIFSARADRVDTVYDQFQDIHNQIMGFISDGDFPQHDEVRKEVDKAYFTIKSILIKNKSSPAPIPIPQSCPKLNKIIIPVFDGNYKNWPTFFDLFNTMINDNDSLSAVAKYQYLLTSLSGEALNLIKGLPVTNDNYIIAYNSLKGRYQNKRHLATLYFNEIVALKPIQEESSKSFRFLIDTFKENIDGFRMLNFPVDQWDFLLFNILLQKLNISTKTKFESEHTTFEIPTYLQLINFLENQAKAFNSVLLTSDKLSMNKNKPFQNYRGKTSVNLKTEDVKLSFKCILCPESHSIYRCSKFLAKSASERLSIARDHNLCRNCLNKNHNTSSCTSNYRCHSCDQRHHTLLHFETKKQPTMHVGTTACNNGNVSIEGANHQVILPIAFVQIRDHFGRLHLARALLDSGSMSNFITTKLSQRLRLPRKSHSLEIHGLNSMTSICNKGIVNCKIQSCQSQNFSCDLKAIVTPSICSAQPSLSRIINSYDHLKCLDFHPEHNTSVKDVDLLLGAELVPQIFTGGRVCGGQNDPIALHSVFGWILMGKSQLSTSTSLSTCVSTTDDSIDSVIQRFWELESISENKTMSLEEEQCEDHYKNTYRRDVSGRFIVSLPFKKDESVLGNSYNIALKRFTLLENRLLKNVSLHKKYVDFMRDYLETNHMSLIPSPDITSIKYYIPHHCIIRDDNQLSKFRVVFDASALSSNGKSLNDVLLIGPKLQQSIVNILINFRFFKYAFTCDIQQMYRQILISPSDRTFQNILWRFSPEEPVQSYQLNTVTYGVSSAPFLALRTILELANVYSNDYPKASHVLKHNVYVDDIVTGASTINETLTLQQELINLLNKGGFKLRKWASNNLDVLTAVSESDLQRPISMDYDETCSVKVLGLQWDPCSDQFSFSYTSHESPCNKRTILSDIARIFDPLGFLTPCTFKAKHFIQQLWSLHLDWDESPPSSIHSEWKTFKHNLSLLSDIHLPRLIIPDQPEHIQLHLFCDASQTGYCAVAYLRCSTSNLITTSFVCAKSRVAPLKTISVPRLELCGATLLADLFSSITNTLSNLPVDLVVAWTDSQVVLHWLHSAPCRWKIFVANRVSHIQNALPPSSWRYVPSHDNPADCGSRGLCPSQLSSFNLWWNGPSWLKEDSDQWPVNPIFKYENNEAIAKESKPILVNCGENQTHFLDHLLTKFSSLSKIQRIISYIRRFILLSKKNRNVNLFSSFSQFELQDSLHVLIKHVQNQHFSCVFNALIKNQLVTKPFRKLTPFIDRDGLLRVGGRLRHSDIPYEHKHPLLLPCDSRLSELIIETIHREYLHPGQRTLHGLLAQRYWILSPRRAIHRVLFKCIRCFRMNPRPQVPLMADLPKYRISEVKAFSAAGVDFAGPIRTTMNRSRGSRSVKSYLCIFLCMSTKAVHLELVTDLTTDAFIAALRRFLSRRGNCINLYSDQGTNFIGANNKLKEIAEATGSTFGIQWHFHPPGAPHFNGLVEAGVKSVKSHLLRVIGEQILTFEEVYTVITQIEAVLNSRPLCPLSSDPNDLLPLTPSHFLCLEPLNVELPSPDFTKSPINRLDRWNLLQRMVQDFWGRWRTEYLHTLQQRMKWNKITPMIKMGDMVVIKDEQRPPLQWTIGRVVEIHPAQDGVVRVVVVKTANGRLMRPVAKLSVLPVN